MKLLDKPLVFEFNSWCCSFRFSYGEEAPPLQHDTSPRRGIGFRTDEVGEEELEEEDDDVDQAGKKS